MNKEFINAEKKLEKYIVFTQNITFIFFWEFKRINLQKSYHKDPTANFLNHKLQHSLNNDSWH